MRLSHVTEELSRTHQSLTYAGSQRASLTVQLKECQERCQRLQADLHTATQAAAEARATAERDAEDWASLEAATRRCAELAARLAASEQELARARAAAAVGAGVPSSDEAGTAVTVLRAQLAAEVARREAAEAAVTAAARGVTHTGVTHAVPPAPHASASAVGDLSRLTEAEGAVGVRASSVGVSGFAELSYLVEAEDRRGQVSRWHVRGWDKMQ